MTNFGRIRWWHDWPPAFIERQRNDSHRVRPVTLGIGQLCPLDDPGPWYAFDLVWIALPRLAGSKGTSADQIPVVQPDPVPILHGLTFRDFAISPDRPALGVIPPGKRNLLLFPLPSPGAC
jgi:hypothetical protein